MKRLSSAEYEAMLQERLLRVNADIALIDENIEALRARERAVNNTMSRGEAAKKPK